MKKALTGHRLPRARQKGSLVMFIVLFLTVFAMIPVGLQLIQTSHKRTARQTHLSVQADNVARAGLVEAISWFRRQPTQPVRSSVDTVAFPWADAAFFPRESTDTVTADTIDETVGLVKEYPLNDENTVWGRFEVRRQPDTSTNPFDPQAVHDISDKRIASATAGEGLAWYIESTGIVYRRRDPAVAYDAPPNEVVGRSRVATEIRRIAIILPVNAAVTVNARNTVTIQTNGQIKGETNVGLAYYSGGSGPSVSGAGAQVAGAPTVTDIDGAGLSGTLLPQTIFGVTENELKLMADYAVSNVNELPATYPSMAVVHVSGNATFNAARPLRGGGILYVDGNLLIDTGSNSLFSGLIYVTGTTTIRGPSTISGAVVCEGSLLMNGTGDVAMVIFDMSILNSVRQQVAQYRENKSAFYTFSGTK